MTPNPLLPASWPAPWPASRRLRSGCAAGALLAALAAGPASAEISAQSVREEFEAAYERMGMTVEVGGEEASGGAVTLSDVVLSFEFTDRESVEEPVEAPGEAPGGEGDGNGSAGSGGDEAAGEGDEEVRVEAAFDTVAFEEQPDGGVRATLPPEGRMTIRSVEIETGAEDVIEMRLVTEGVALTVTESEAAGEAEGGAREPGRRYALAADRLGAVLGEVTLDGEPVEASGEAAYLDVSATVDAEPGAGPTGEARRYVVEARAAEMAASADLPSGGPEDGSEDGPENGEAAAGGRMTIETRGAEIALTGEGTMPPEEAMAGIGDEDGAAAAFEGGFALRGEIAQGAGSSRVEATGPEEGSRTFVIETRSEGSRFVGAIDGDALGVSGRSDGLRYAIEDPSLAAPRIEAALEETELALEMPLSQSAEPRPFALRYSLAGLTLNEEAWDLFDPEARLPRDPASLLLALEGGVRLLADLYDAEAQAAAEETGETLVEVEDATLTLRLDALGAAVDAGGEFTFDNADTTTFEGVPAPTGTLTIEAEGIDALLDTLSDMGLVPPDQLMPARLMLGLFARPDGEGGYTSEIAVDGETGAVTANGQRLR